MFPPARNSTGAANVKALVTRFGCHVVSAKSRSTCLNRRWCTNIVPSMNATFAARQAAIISLTSFAFTPTGFSTRICFPAAAAFSTHSLCSLVGNGM